MPRYPSGKESVVYSNIQELPEAGTLGHAIAEIENHLHPVGGTKLYPMGSVPITISSGTSADLFGDWTEIIPADFVLYKYDAHRLYAANVSDVAQYYIIELGVGSIGNESAIDRTVVGATSSSKGVIQFDLNAELINANERLSARVKDNEAAINTIDVAIGYHEYPMLP